MGTFGKIDRLICMGFHRHFGSVHMRGSEDEKSYFQALTGTS